MILEKTKQPRFAFAFFLAKQFVEVDEVVQPSRLDSLLQHMERCCVLWRKRRTGQGVQAMQDDEPEAKDADDFVELVTPRALSVLLALAKQNLGYLCESQLSFPN